MKIFFFLLLFSGILLLAQEKPLAIFSNSVSTVITDSTVSAESDSSEEEEEILPWTLIVRTEFEKTRIKKGVDLSGTNPTFSSYVSLFHGNGWNGSIAWSSMLGSDGGPLNWYANIGYDNYLNDWLGLSVGAAHTKYLADSINSISDLENSLSLGLTADLTVVEFGISYEIYFGADAAKYFTADVGHSFTFGSLNVALSASMTYLSQTIDAAKLGALAIKQKKNQTGSVPLTRKKTSISGISNYSLDLDVHYDLPSGFSIYLDPSLIISPKGEVSAKDRQLSWTMGVKYSTDF